MALDLSQSFLDKNHLIQITNQLYRLTLLFPKKEPLKYKMRELADEILADTLRITNQYGSTNKAENCSPRALVNLEILDSFFEVAKNQNWISPLEISRIQEEYSRIKAETKKIPKRPLTEGKREVEGVEVKPQQPYPRDQALVNQRQEKILSFLKEKGRAQVWEIQQIFPGVTKRTLRRDFGRLLKQGSVERIGERNNTFYQLKKG